MWSRKKKPPKPKQSRRQFRRKRVHQDGEPSGLDLIEEGMHLLRHASLGAWTMYLCGAVPFLFGFLFFWTEMVSSGLAERSLLPGALGVGVLFVWFKVAQACFADGLRSALHGEAPRRWTLAEWLTVLRRQSFWQATGLIVLPVAFVVTIPFPWVSAFYQNILISDPRDKASDGDVVKESWRLSRLWTGQNWMLVTLLGMVYLLSFINWLTCLLVGPYLLKTLLGVETVFSRSGFHLLNSTTLFICLLLAYVVTDPLAKAVYLLRHHYCESRRSGADLLLRLRRSLAANVVLLGIGFLCVGTVVSPSRLDAQEQTAAVAQPSVDAAELDASINEVLERREFVWRFPREEIAEQAAEEPAWFESLTEMLKRWEEKINRWIEDLFGKEAQTKSDRSWDGFAGLGETLSYLLIGIFVLLLIYFGVRAFKMYQPVELLEGDEGSGAEVVPDLNDEDVAADTLPRNRWVEIARELIAEGDYRLALRAYFLAQLSALSSEGLIVVRLAKSNREYAKELERRAHGQVNLPELYRQEMGLFESVWYGNRVSGLGEIQEMERYLTETGVLV
jgi:hypothetical protein